MEKYHRRAPNHCIRHIASCIHVPRLQSVGIDQKVSMRIQAMREDALCFFAKVKFARCFAFGDLPYSTYTLFHHPRMHTFCGARSYPSCPWHSLLFTRVHHSPSYDSRPLPREGMRSALSLGPPSPSPSLSHQTGVSLQFFLQELPPHPLSPTSSPSAPSRRGGGLSCSKHHPSYFRGLQRRSSRGLCLGTSVSFVRTLESVVRVPSEIKKRNTCSYGQTSMKHLDVAWSSPSSGRLKAL